MPTREIHDSEGTSHWPRLLVVAGYEPGNQQVGAILTRQILECIPADCLRMVVIAPRGSVKHPGSFTNALLERRYEYSYRPVGGWLGKIAEYIAHRILFQPYVKKLVSKCVEQGREHRCDGVLVVLESPTLIALAESLARRLNVPLYCFVMDAPRFLCDKFGYTRITSNLIFRQFESALIHAKSVGVAGESMQMAYDSLYNSRSVILRQGVSHKISSVTPSRLQNDHRVRIGFAGTITAPEALDSLLQALQLRSWRLGGKQVVLRFVGTEIRLIPTGPMSIEHFGWRSVDELIELMGECDALYLPQPFSETSRECAELSFPNKLCTYLPARRPIALHAPHYASLHEFYSRFPCGPVSSELDATNLLDLIEKALTSTTEYDRYVENVELAFATELNQKRLSEAVCAFIGVTSEAATYRRTM